MHEGEKAQNTSDDNDFNVNAPEEPDEVNEYERDGWEIGFQVEMNGVAQAHYVLDEGDDSSDGFVSDTDTEDGGEERAHRDQYRPLPTEPPSHSDAPDMMESNEEDVQPPDSQEVEQDQPSSQNAKAAEEEQIKDAKGRQVPRDIHLDEGKIDEIKKAMAGFVLPPCQRLPEDEKLVALVNTLTTSTKNRRNN